MRRPRRCAHCLDTRAPVALCTTQAFGEALHELLASDVGERRHGNNAVPTKGLSSLAYLAMRIYDAHLWR